MRIATARFPVMLGVHAVEARVELIDLRNQLVDPLHDVLALLIRFQELAVEGADPLAAVLELATQARVLGTLVSVGGGQLGDDLLESLEVESVRRDAWPGSARPDLSEPDLSELESEMAGPGRSRILPGDPETRQAEFR
jgi:hypothetical protein